MGDKTTDKNESFKRVRWDSYDRKRILMAEDGKVKFLNCIVFYWLIIKIPSKL